MKLRTVTFSGASEQTPMDEMLAISNAHPFVEWGIQTPHYGGGIFPGRSWVRELTTLASKHENMHISGHMCDVRSLIQDGDNIFPEIEGYKIWDRFQINTHGSPHFMCPEFEDIISEVTKNHEVIFQLDNVTENQLTYLMLADKGYDVSGFFDTSHGSGSSPDKWPDTAQRPRTYKYGYSGGLGPDNIRAELDRIAEVTGEDQVIWVDMEGKLRSYGVGFDLEKVKQVIEEVEKSGYLL